jgi:hypothetical protein
MTTTRFVLARRASLLVWLLPLGVAGLSVACGSSPGMVGVSAGAAGVNTGTAGADSTSGGSGSGHAGSGSTPTAGSTGDAGGSIGDAGGSIGGAATGGSTGEAGSSSAGASIGGSPNTGGASGAAGSPGTGGAGGAGGGACVKDADCGAGNECLYKIADACTAKGSCFKKPGGALCASISSYCGCLGQEVGVPCYEPTGYSPTPVTGPKSTAACPAGPDPRCAGKTCGAQCDNGEFPAACDFDGNCTLVLMASGCP